jgi:hypothetical protein
MFPTLKSRPAVFPATFHLRVLLGMIEVSSMNGKPEVTPFHAVDAGIIQRAAFAGQIRRAVQ